MCEFVSWINYDGKNYFITETDLQTKEGRELLKQYNNDIFHEDVVGHGFIRAFYLKLNGKGQNKECTDFSSPKNFPPEIVKQIKAGNMKFKVIPELIEGPARAEYEKIEGSAFWKLFKIKKNRAKEWK